jgi:riboflavin synthase
MFTGIIQEVGHVLDAHPVDGGLRLTVETPKSWEGLQLGESISTNGVCLTVDKIGSRTYDCIVIPETLEVSTFGRTVPKRINLERSMSVGSLLGGHFVYGHVDGIGKVRSVAKQNGYDIYFDYSTELLIYKGSVAINGVSLTVAEVDAAGFRVSLVPHTLKQTNLGQVEPGDMVNIEDDVIGKYIQKLMGSKSHAES